MPQSARLAINCGQQPEPAEAAETRWSALGGSGTAESAKKLVHRRPNLYPTSGKRVGVTQGYCPQSQNRPEPGTSSIPRCRAFGAVERIAHDRVAARRQMHADLVRAPGDRLGFDEACVAAAPQDF